MGRATGGMWVEASGPAGSCSSLKCLTRAQQIQQLVRGEQHRANLGLAPRPATLHLAPAHMLNGTRQREHDDEDGGQDAGKRLNVQQADQGPGHYVGSSSGPFEAVVGPSWLKGELWTSDRS